MVSFRLSAADCSPHDRHTMLRMLDRLSGSRVTLWSTSKSRRWSSCIPSFHLLTSNLSYEQAPQHHHCFDWKPDSPCPARSGLALGFALIAFRLFSSSRSSLACALLDFWRSRSKLLVGSSVSITPRRLGAAYSTGQGPRPPVTARTRQHGYNNSLINLQLAPRMAGMTSSVVRTKEDTLGSGDCGRAALPAGCTAGAANPRCRAVSYRLDPPVCPHLRRGDAALVTMHHLGACTLTVPPRRSDSVFFEIFRYHARPILALAVTTCPVVDTCSLVTSRYDYPAQAPHALRCGSLRLSRTTGCAPVQHLDPFRSLCFAPVRTMHAFETHRSHMYVLLNSEHSYRICMYS